MSIKKLEILKILYLGYKIRITDEIISKKYIEKKIRCPVHLSIGQEIPSAVLNVLLDKKDFAISYHRSHAHYLAKGGSIKKLIAEIYGKETGCSKGVGGSMHLIDLKNNFLGSTAIVSNSIPVGVGYAYPMLNKKNPGKVCVYLGDASCEEGVFFESLNISILKKLPVIFFCENNGYSVYSPLKNRQPKDRKLFNLARSFRINSFHFSSFNPLKLYSGLKKILNNDNFPVFIEVETYRHYEHCGPNIDDNLGYRSKKESTKWLKKDPLIFLENFVIKNNLFSKFQINDLKYSITKEVEDAFLFAEKSKPLRYKDYLRLSK